MTNAGWYPDPAGAPDTYRYWDGQAWSQMTTTNPGGGGAVQQPGQQPQAPQAPQTQQPQQQSPYGAPTQFPPGQGPSSSPGQAPYGAMGGYGQPGHPGQPGVPGQGGQPGWSQGQPSGGTGGGGKGKTIGIVIAAVLALVLVGVGGFFGIRALTGDDDEPSSRGGDDGSSETSEGTSESTDPGGESSSSTVVPTGIQCTGGEPTPATPPGSSPTEISGGGLTIPVQDGYIVDVAVSDAHSFADDILVQYKEVTNGWISEFAVGGLPLDNGYSSTEQAAEIVMQCLTMNDRIYRGFDSRTDLESKEIEVDGKPAHQITAEIRVQDPEVSVEGDVTTVIVVDTGDSSQYGVFLGVATIGEPDNISLAEQVIDQIKVN